jgi:hypothetical protein
MVRCQGSQGRACQLDNLWKRRAANGGVGRLAGDENSEQKLVRPYLARDHRRHQRLDATTRCIRKKNIQSSSGKNKRLKFREKNEVKRNVSNGERGVFFTCHHVVGSPIKCKEPVETNAIVAYYVVLLVRPHRRLGPLDRPLSCEFGV